MDRFSNNPLYFQDATLQQEIQDRLDSLMRTYGIKYIQSFFKTPREIQVRSLKADCI